jgi:Cdc6-like AAA superfamily ATPase
VIDDFQRAVSDVRPDISGVPGTGKTATVRRVLDEIKAANADDVLFRLFICPATSHSSP